MMTKLDFCQRLVEERKRLGLTQAQFAEACGVTKTSQLLYEKCHRTPNAEYLLKAATLGVQIDYLFGRTPCEPPSLSITDFELADIYTKTDESCRDKQGRLLDRQYRIQEFIKLFRDSANRLTKRNVDGGTA